MAAPASNIGGLGARRDGEMEGNGRGRHGLLIGVKKASNHGFKRRGWRGGDHGREDAGSSLEEGDEMTSSLASHGADRWARGGSGRRKKKKEGRGGLRGWRAATRAVFAGVSWAGPTGLARLALFLFFLTELFPLFQNIKTNKTFK